MKDYLVTGTTSGLGRYISENLECDQVTRKNPLSKFQDRNVPYRAIIHCAFNMQRNICTENLLGYLEDTLFLTRQLCQVPHDVFILLSTIDVYLGQKLPNSKVIFDEDTTLVYEQIASTYGRRKFECEAIVLSEASAPVIFRPGTLLGPYMRQNNITRLLSRSPHPLTLSRESSYYCVGYSNVMDAIFSAIDGALNGIVNLIPKAQVTLGEIAEVFSTRAEFGSFLYSPPLLSNRKLVDCLKYFPLSSMEVVKDTFAKGDIPV